METKDRNKNKVGWLPGFASTEKFAGIVSLAIAIIVAIVAVVFNSNIAIVVVCGIIFAMCFAVIMRLILNPDSAKAKQTESMLNIADEMVELMSEGMSPDVAQSICELLLPHTAAIAVAITNKTNILGYAGYLENENPQGAKLRTQATHDTIADGIARVLYTPEEIGLPNDARLIRSAIIVPLQMGKEVVGTLKFYFRKSSHITETQKSIALGLGKLISTEKAAVELEEQKKLATDMELKMLQSQIDPHFLFNTINTIASLIRTDAPKARDLLRDFAQFYRATLENAEDRIELERELKQTLRYLSFEQARFGEDRLNVVVDIDSASQRANYEISKMLIPPFMIQPIVENAVKHAMPAEGMLTISIIADVEDADIHLSVVDDGIGMSEETCHNIMHPKSQTGLGIAVKNVNDRLHGFYGPDARMLVRSKLGEGSVVTLVFPNIIV